MAWTKEQQAAIDSRGQTLLLSAAAGSGKTAVLVERIIQRLLDAEQPVDITELLVVTFTKAAAAEMRERIGTALTRVLAEGGSPQVEKQLALLPSAHISTLHSFCQAVIRRYFYTIDVDPKFVVAGEEELGLLRRSVLENVFLSYYEDENKASLLYPLVDMFGNDRGDEALMDTIGRIYDYSRSMAWPDHWLDQIVAAYAIPEEAHIDDLPWSGDILRRVQEMLSEQFRVYERLVRDVTVFPALAGGVSQFEAERDALAAAANSEGWEAVQQAVQAVSFDRLKGLRKLTEEEKEWWEGCKKRRDGVKAVLKDLQETYFSAPPDVWLRDIRSMGPIASGLVRLTRDFGQAYSLAKKEKGWIDFSDLEHFCLRILLAPESTPEQPCRSAAAEELSRSFQEVLIDEYQDTNGVQELITTLAAREDNRFMVGDIKQSIYRFRLADPTLFLKKYRTFSRDAQAPERCIDLSRNFRSAPNILEGVNEVFARAMTERAAGMPYGERERLYAGRPECHDEGWVGGPLEIHLLDTAEDSADTGSEEQEERELTAFERECLMVAQRLRRLKDSGLQAARKDGSLEPLSWRHMVILLRSLAGKAGVMLQALQAAGIPAYADQSSGYFAAVEVQVMLALLRCIDNPEQDLPMAAVLRSPLVGLDEEALAGLRLSGGDTLWQNLPAYIEGLPEGGQRQKLDRFRTLLETWRTVGRRCGVAELLQRLYTDTAYFQYAGGMPGGTARQANLQALYDRARQYEEAGYRGLFRYLKFLDRLRDNGVDLAPAKVLGEGEDVVRVMSIHKSKGLEFPVVVIADMGKGFNRQDLKSPVLFHQDGGMGLKYYDAPWRLFYPTLIWHGLAAKLDWENVAEEERVLYVAMTRARDKLILTGHVRNLEKSWSAWQEDPEPGRASSYLDWVMPVAAGRDEAAPLGDMIRHGRDGTVRCGLWELAVHHGLDSWEQTENQTEQDQRLAALRQGDDLGTATPSWLEQQLSWRYAYPQAVQTPAKFSVTEIKQNYQLRQEALRQEEEETAFVASAAEEESFPQAPWLQEERDRSSGARRGTALHKAMQYVTIRPDLTIPDLQAEMASWQEKGWFSQEEAALVPATAILAFCRSSLGQRMAGAEKLQREYPFTVLFAGGDWLPELEAGETVLVQGVADCLFREKEGWVLVDYKTDRMDGAEAFRQRYAVQLSLYRRAMEQILGESVKEACVYSFHLQEVIVF